MELVLIRHARPHRIENAAVPADPELTELGQDQAAAMARWLGGERFDALYTSPMVRARQTASPLEKLLGLDAEVVEGVKEYDAESLRYIPLEELKADRERWRAFLATEGAEDRTEFSATVTGALEELIGRHRGQRIVVVCHGGVINVWAARVLGMAPDLFFEPHYTSVNRFMAASSGERSVVSLNEIGHLRGVDPAH